MSIRGSLSLEFRLNPKGGVSIVANLTGTRREFSHRLKYRGKLIGVIVRALNRDPYSCKIKVSNGVAALWVRRTQRLSKAPWLRVEETHRELPQEVIQEIEEWLASISWPRDSLFYRKKGEKREKGTDVVLETSSCPSENSTVHGGDGNSQEVENRAETASEDASSMDANSIQEDDSSVTSEDRSHGQGISEPSDAEKEPEPSQQRPSDRSSRKGLEEWLLKRQPPLKEPVSPTGSKNKGSTGGMCPQPGKVWKNRDMVSLADVLVRLFRDFRSNRASTYVGGTAKSTKVSGSKLVKEVATRRLNLQRIYRDNTTPKPEVILAAVDESGSCSSTSGGTRTVLEWLVEHYDNIVMVRHANGRYPKIISRCSRFKPPTERGREFWDAVAKQACGAVLFGDSDGHGLWSVLGQICPTVQLDSYGCSHGRAYEVHPFEDNIKYYRGVGDPKTAAYALRHYRRNNRL